MIQTMAVTIWAGVLSPEENLMRVLQTVLAYVLILVATSTASAQQVIKGTVTAIDELGGTISIQQADGSRHDRNQRCRQRVTRLEMDFCSMLCALAKRWRARSKRWMVLERSPD
jgi:hypothetical protein